MDTEVLVTGLYIAERIAKDQVRDSATMVDHGVMLERCNSMTSIKDDHGIEKVVMASESNGHDVGKEITISANNDHEDAEKAIMISERDNQSLAEEIKVSEYHDHDLQEVILMSQNDYHHGEEVSMVSEKDVENEITVSEMNSHDVENTITISEKDNHDVTTMMGVSDDNDDDIWNPDIGHVEVSVILMLKNELQDDESECRVCHLTFTESQASETIQLGCHCKDGLALAHRNCAEAWFKIKGNRICEICGAPAQNIVGAEDSGFMEQWNDMGAENGATNRQTDCWQSLSLCNFLLACMVVIFILLWLFRISIS